MHHNLTWGAGQQQVRSVWSNTGCWHLNPWMYTLVELCTWDVAKPQLKDRGNHPWDNPDRRPSHAARRINWWRHSELAKIGVHCYEEGASGEGRIMTSGTSELKIMMFHKTVAMAGPWDVPWSRMEDMFGAENESVSGSDGRIQVVEKQ